MACCDIKLNGEPDKKVTTLFIFMLKYLNLRFLSGFPKIVCQGSHQGGAVRPKNG